MPEAKTNRKQLFRAALAIAGLTARQWAEQEGTSESYLSLVLNGKRNSEAVTQKIDAFTQEQQEHMTAAYSALAS